MFTVNDRDHIRDRVLEMAESDARIVAGAIVGALERDELLRAFRCAIEGLLRESDEVRELALKVEPQLRELMII
jgi:hypothetical protein